MHRFVASGFYAGLIPQRLWGSDNGAGTFGAAVAVVISLLLWGMLWGIPGALMAVPITAVAKILLEKFEETRVIAEVMAGRLDRWRSPEPA